MGHGEWTVLEVNSKFLIAIVLKATDRVNCASYDEYLPSPSPDGSHFDQSISGWPAGGSAAIVRDYPAVYGTILRCFNLKSTVFEMMRNGEQR